MKKEVMLVADAGQIGMAIARRVGFGKKIILGDKKNENAIAIAKTMNEAGFDVEPFEMDLSSRVSIKAIDMGSVAQNILGHLLRMRQVIPYG